MTKIEKEIQEGLEELSRMHDELMEEYDADEALMDS